MITGCFSHCCSASKRTLLRFVSVFVALIGLEAITTQAGEQVDFNRDVRRVLSDNCFKCHGPDAKERKGGKKGVGLRLDVPEGAFADLGERNAIVPRHPEKSELVRRITTGDPDDKMPPPKSGKKLNAEEIALLKKWIEHGAQYAIRF